MSNGDPAVGPQFRMFMIHTGEIVNIYTTYGANEFLKQRAHKDDFKFFSAGLERADAIRKKGKKKKKLNFVEKENLVQIYIMLLAIADFSDKLLFRARVPEREVKAWLSHAATVLQEIAKSEHWIQTGEMLPHDDALLRSCCVLFKHPLPVAIVFEDRAYFESLVALFRARKGNLTPHFAQVVELTVGNIFSCTICGFDNNWEPERTLKKLEAEGILEQFIRCIAVQRPYREVQSLKYGLLRYLLPFVAFVEKRFKSGTPCGDALRRIFSSRMEIRPQARPYLQDLLRMSYILEGSNLQPELGFRVCQFCSKKEQETSFMLCSRCQLTCYCSKECQRADWKRHKPKCLPPTKNLQKSRNAIDTLLEDYASKHFVKIMFAMLEECETEVGLGMRDMVLELDYNPDKDGYVPALQREPKFKIIPNSKYRQAEIERGAICGEQFECFEASLKDRQTSDLVCFCLFSEGSKSIASFQKGDPVTGGAMYTEEVFIAFREAYLHGDYEHLARTFPKEDRWKHYVRQIEMLRPRNQAVEEAT